MSYANSATYAKLGQSCQVNFDMLTDNSKYLSQNNPRYSMLYTQFRRYPGPEIWQGIPEPEIREVREKDSSQRPVKSCCGSTN